MQPPAETNTKPLPSITGREHECECEVSRKCAFKEPLESYEDFDQGWKSRDLRSEPASSVLKDTTLK